MNNERIVTILIMVGLFGGLIGGPIASLADYHAPPQKRLWYLLFQNLSALHVWD